MANDPETFCQVNSGIPDCAVGGLCAAVADYMLTGTTDTLFAMMAAETATIMADPVAGAATGDILGGDTASAATDYQLATESEAKFAAEVQQ